ncbi:hypothetical protein K431DRAFT_280095 [Polychaeton citri CBS 116435]|uniref:Cupin type-2 domain-containing protein n=1 Tax=Polychaeton citri CBS 116435 TaxID=1314669 RepID=A0A9P4QJH6_9PEZI|nr:hypothetical protein K431DRAFT_280095 [Polychaeton citri CBS 116435]
MAGIVGVPDVPINFVPATSGEVLNLGMIKCRVMEDGSRTDNRIGSAEFTVPAKTPGPPAHWHEMHDETFLVTKGTIRFHVPDPENPGKDLKYIDAHEGDYVTVPTRSPHTFSNPTDGESKFFNTYTPAYYINYFKLLSTMGDEGKPMPAEANVQAMALYATLPVHKLPAKKD